MIRPLASLLAGAALLPAQEPLRALPFDAVQLNDVFWTPRVFTALRTSIDACLDQCEKTGRIANFANAGKLLRGEPHGPHQGARYNDSDVYKVLEGAAYALRFGQDAELRQRVEQIIALVSAAQHPNGYLNTHYTLKEPDKRWQDIAHGHELYCAGHLIEAGIAWQRSTGSDALLQVGRRFATRIAELFGPGAGQRKDPPGHQELELALFRLEQQTGERRWGALARFFLDVRGKPLGGRRLYGTYSQDHQPIAAQTAAVGHAVRAMYQAVGATASLRGRPHPQLRRSLLRLWEDIHAGKIYVTGGIGAVAGIEGFAPAYELPNDKAYAETCAAIAIAMWDQRLFLMERRAAFVDGLERALYNGMLSGVSLNGDRFFYRNPLGSKGDHARSAWFHTACCPTNLARYLPRIPGQIYAHDADELYVLLYIGSRAEVPLAAGKLRVYLQSEVPWQGEVLLQLDPAAPQQLGLRLRLPPWTQVRALAQLRLRLNGVPLQGAELKAGFIHIDRRFAPGDQLRLRLPLPVRRVEDDPRVAANRGRISLQRGPLVYCLEGVDHGGTCRDLYLPAGTDLRPRFDRRLLGGVVALEGQGRRRGVAAPVEVRAIPYYTWANRGKSDMQTWIPVREDLAEPR